MGRDQSHSLGHVRTGILTFIRSLSKVEVSETEVSKVEVCEAEVCEAKVSITFRYLCLHNEEHY